MSTISSWTYVPSFEGDRIMEKVLSTENNDPQYLMDPPSNFPRGATIFHVSCHTVAIPHIVYTAQRILEALEVPFVSIGGPENCCGSRQWSFEDDVRGRQVANLTLSAFRRLKPSRVVSTCPDCDLVFAFYRGSQHKFQQSNVLDVFYENRGRLKELMRNPVRKRVIIHSHDVNAMRERDKNHLRELIELIPGVEVLEASCAGGLGNHCMHQIGRRYKDNLPDPVVHAMFQEARDLHADALVVPYHGCYRNHVKRKIEYGVEVFHYQTLLAAGMGIPYRERFKEIRMLDSIDAAMRELGPKASEYGFSEAQLRTALEQKVYV